MNARSDAWDNLLVAPAVLLRRSLASIRGSRIEQRVLRQTLHRAVRVHASRIKDVSVLDVDNTRRRRK